MTGQTQNPVPGPATGPAFPVGQVFPEGLAFPEGPAFPVAPLPSRRRNNVRRGRGGLITTALLSVLLIAALALGTYLWYAADHWHTVAAAWEGQARAQGARVAQLQTSLATTGQQLETTSQELSAVQLQLTTATDRITELANEKAQIGDDAAKAGLNLDNQQRINQAAGVIADALKKCTDGQAQLIEYLKTPSQYDATSLQNYADQVQALCQQASDANAQLQQELAGAQ
jgi:hypothetical protein